MNKAVLVENERVKIPQVKVFVFPKIRPKMSFFGKGRNIFGDGVKFQRKIRKEWQ